MSDKQLLHLFLLEYAYNKIHRLSGLGAEPFAAPVVAVERRYALVNSLLAAAALPSQFIWVYLPIKRKQPRKGGTRGGLSEN